MKYTPRQLILMALALVALIAVYIWSNSQSGSPSGTPSEPPPGFVSRATFGERWPLTVEEGVLACRGSGGVGAVTFTAGNTTYAVNGIAVQDGTFTDIKAIWADNPDVAGLKKDIGPLIERGLALCS